MTAPISLTPGSSIVRDTTPGIDGPGGHQREHPLRLPTATTRSDACSRETPTSGETDSSMMSSATAGSDTPSTLQQHAQTATTCESTRREDVVYDTEDPTRIAQMNDEMRVIESMVIVSVLKYTAAGFGRGCKRRTMQRTLSRKKISTIGLNDRASIATLSRWFGWNLGARDMGKDHGMGSGL